MPTVLRRLQPCLLLLAVVISGGCNINFEQDPAETVTVEISGISDEADRESVQETLTGMTDGSNHFYTSSYSGDQMSISISPVSDVEAFAKKINFGNVTNVDVASRTVTVEFIP